MSHFPIPSTLSARASSETLSDTDPTANVMSVDGISAFDLASRGYMWSGPAEVVRATSCSVSSGEPYVTFSSRGQSSRWLPSVAQVSLPPELAVHVRYAQCPGSALALNCASHPSVSSSCQRIDRATDLLDPELFVFRCLLQPEVLCFHVFDGSTPAAGSQTSCCCCSFSLMSQFTSRVGQSNGLACTVDHTAVFCRRCSATPPSDDRRQRVSPNAQAASRC